MVTNMESKTESDMGVTLNPKRFDISMVFFRDTNKYPQKGSIVRVDHSTYCSHIEEVEKNRSEPDVTKNGETFCIITQSYQKMLYHNYYNKTQPHLKNDIPMVVEEIFFEGKEIVARCSANGYNYPIDSVEEMKLVLPADDLTVVDIVLCDYIAIYSDVKPNTRDYMGFFDKNTSNDMGDKLYQKFRIREDYPYTELLREQVIKNGIKEFSFIYPINPITKKPVLLDNAQYAEDVDNHKQPPNVEGSVESLSMDHPLSTYTRRMFVSVMENLDHGKISEDDINNIYFDMLSVMKDTFIGINNNIIMTEKDIEKSDSVDRDY